MRVVFDVESNGLHGPGFAVGWIVEKDGVILERGYEAARITGEVDPWVEANVLPNLPEATVGTVGEVRDLFWATWVRWKEQGATLWADCGWPVEARFLIACVEDNPKERTWEGPYPLNEIATVLATAESAFGKDPTDYRTPDELPHHPTHDCIISLRQLQAAERSLLG